MIKQTEDFKRYGAKVLSITNDENRRSPKWQIQYFLLYARRQWGKEVDLNLTTQVPVITPIEL